MTYSKRIILTLLIALCCYACKKEGSSEINEKPEFGFTQYTIPAGGDYSVDSTKLVLLNGITEMKFKFKFDSSAIYTTKDPMNQADVNKLYGFADGVSFTTRYTIPPHHINSARIGWAYVNKALRIYAYYYNDSVQLFKELQPISIGKTYTAGIKILQGGYEFTVGEKKDTVPRTCPLPTIVGYKLFPYFGGTEKSPKEVRIWVKDL